MSGQNRSQRQPANHDQRNQSHLHRPAETGTVPASIVNQTSTANTANIARAAQYFRSRSAPVLLLLIRFPSPCDRFRAIQTQTRIPAATVTVSLQLSWCTGEDSNLRSSQGAADLQSAAINHSATCAQTKTSHQRFHPSLRRSAFQRLKPATPPPAPPRFRARRNLRSPPDLRTLRLKWILRGVEARRS